MIDYMIYFRMKGIKTSSACVLFLFFMIMGLCHIEGQTVEKAAVVSDQHSINLQKGNAAYSAKKYFLATAFYQYYITSHTNVPTDLWLKLADCYWQMREYRECLGAYEQGIEKEKPLLSDVDKVRLSELQAREGHYREAAGWLKGIPGYHARAVAYTDSIQQRRMHSDSSCWKVQLLNINTGYRLFSPFLYDSTLLFSSNQPFINRTKMSDVDGMNFSKLWQISVSNLFVDFKGNDSLRGVQPERSQISQKRLAAIFEGADNKTFTMDKSVIEVSPYLQGKVLPGMEVKGLSDIRSNAGAIAMDKNRHFYFSANYDKVNGVNHLRLMEGIYDGKGVANIHTLPFGDDNSYSVMHPAVNQDGTILIFSSDKSGGKGGFDLYYSRSVDKGETWEKARNLSVVNTVGNEVFPSITSDGYLYFSSDGRPGFGGLDIYRIPLTAAIAGKDSIEHLPNPINSVGDDFGWTQDSTGLTGFFTSDRLNSNDNLYYYRYYPKMIPIVGYIRDPKTNAPIAGATVFVYAKSEGKVHVLKTDKQGRYSINMKAKYSDVLVKSARPHAGGVQSQGTADFTYVEPHSDLLSTTDGSTNRTVGVKRSSRIVGNAGQSNAKNNLEELNKTSGSQLNSVDAKSQGESQSAGDLAYGEPQSDLLSTTDGSTNRTVGAKRSSRIVGNAGQSNAKNNLGELNKTPGSQLNSVDAKSQGESQSAEDLAYGEPQSDLLGMTNGSERVMVSRSVGAKRSSRMTESQGQSDTEPVFDVLIKAVVNPYDSLLHGRISTYSSDCVLFRISKEDKKVEAQPHPLSLNKFNVGMKWVKRNIYYDFDQWALSDQAKLVLDSLVIMLKAYPIVNVELGSHADQIGSMHYNDVLSQRRADASKAYIVSQGIKASRIKAQGYGQRQLLNPCTECSDEERQVNRRTEIKVLGYTFVQDKKPKKDETPVPTFDPMIYKAGQDLNPNDLPKDFFELPQKEKEPSAPVKEALPIPSADASTAIPNSEYHQVESSVAGENKTAIQPDAVNTPAASEQSVQPAVEETKAQLPLSSTEEALPSADASPTVAGSEYHQVESSVAGENKTAIQPDAVNTPAASEQSVQPAVEETKAQLPLSSTEEALPSADASPTVAGSEYHQVESSVTGENKTAIQPDAVNTPAASEQSVQPAVEETKAQLPLSSTEEALPSADATPTVAGSEYHQVESSIAGENKTAIQPDVVNLPVVKTLHTGKIRLQPIVRRVGEKYIIQLGAFKSESNAFRFSVTMKSVLASYHFTHLMQKNGAIYEIKIGYFNDQQEALSVANELRHKFF
jgi:outer membrane protein OmpA-like peptidoglycan-associated protein